jgi:DNA polymerase
VSDGEKTRQAEVAQVAAELRRHLAWLADAGVREVPERVSPVHGLPAAQGIAAAGHPGSGIAPGSAAIGRPGERPASSPSGSRYAPGEKGCGSAALLAVRQQLGECRRCKLAAGRTNLVFGVGNPGSELMFVGEGPGEDEDRQGEPFVGRAGQLLTKMIGAMGYGREQIYIANVVKCRPPGNRNPEPDEILACEPFLRGQIDAIRPKVIVALGKFAAQTLLRDTSPISRLRGRWFEYEGVRLMPTFHPAYLLRSPNEKGKAWEDLQLVMKELGKPLGKGR